MRLLSFGHGYSAQALAEILLPLGWKIRATTRGKEKFSKIMEDALRRGGGRPDGNRPPRPDGPRGDRPPPEH